MSNIQAVIRVTDQLIARVLDQRQFTAGEINYLTRELNNDQNCLELNFDKTLKINESACLIADSNNSDLYASYERKVCAAGDRVGSLVEQAEKLLKMANENRERNERCLAEKRKQIAQLRQMPRHKTYGSLADTSSTRPTSTPTAQQEFTNDTDSDEAGERATSE